MIKCIITLHQTFTVKNQVKRKRDDVIGEWRRLHNKELYAIYSSPNITRVIKSRRLTLAGHVARVGGKERCLQGFSKET